MLNDDNNNTQHDLRELVTNGGLPNDIVKSSKVDLPAGGVVVQVINVRNVSAPKVNQESKTSPRLLQIDLTDGQTLCSGLDLEHLSAFSINVAPGTKVLLRNTIKVIQGFLSLTPQNISILGGHVQTLYERWETNRTLAKYTAAAISGGLGASSKKSNGETLKGSPPPWSPFGNKMKDGTGDDAANFKSLAAITKTKEVSKEESEFLATRNAAIAEASTKGEVRKHFGGSNRQLMDHNVKKIMDKGFSEDAAKQALKIARNNLERAMSGLKKRSGNPNSNEMAPYENRQDKTASSSFGGRGRGSDRRGGREGREGRDGGGGGDLAPAKPSGKVSLFDFLSDKIPDVEPLPQQKPTNSRLPEYSSGGGRGGSHSQGRNAPSSSKFDNNARFENNMSSSFASRQKKEDSYGGGGGGGGGRNKWNDNNGPNDKSSKPTTTSTFQQYQGSQQSSHQHQQHQQQQQQSSYKSSHSNNHGYHASNNSNNYHQNNAKNSRYQNQSASNPPASDSHQHQHHQQQQQQQQHQYSDMVVSIPHIQNVARKSNGSKR